MAQWKETLEPYVKVIESVKTTPLNPTAGENLVLGAVIISDNGPADPTLITSQSEFLEIYASEELTKDYIKSLDALYTSDSGSGLASTMWLNAYRLAGSANLLVCRASRGGDVIYSKPLTDGMSGDYVIKDSEILKRISGGFKFVLDKISPGSADGWAIAVDGVGIIGNRVQDDGPVYDYFAKDLGELISILNETNKFYSSKYEFYLDNKATQLTTDPSKAVSVVLRDVYLGSKFLDKSVLTGDNEASLQPNAHNVSAGLAYIFAAELDWEYSESSTQDLLDLNHENLSGFDSFEYYASNLYNTKSDLKIRIRRFNHNAVAAESTKNSSESPWKVLTNVIENYHNNQTDPNNPDLSSRYYDFYEFAVLDPTISSDWVLFNVGNLPGRGDITVEELKNSLGMIYLNLPEDLIDLGLNYYDYPGDDNSWNFKSTLTATKLETSGSTTYAYDSSNNRYVIVPDVSALPDEVAINTTYAVTTSTSNSDKTYDLYIYTTNTSLPYKEISIDLSLSDGAISLLEVSDQDIMMAWDKIEDDERYVVEGFSDLGCTYPNIQKYVANIAVNSNYFYAFSTPNTTNYMTIASGASKMIKNHKLYAAAPWDYDSGTVGFKFAVSPSTLYWEAVMRNRQNNNEFAGVFGQNTGRVNIMSLAKEFKKSERQLLLSKKINTISYDNYLGSYYFNDNYTYTEDSHVLSEECNSRLQIRISKAMPLLLNQFKGRQNTAKTRKEIREVIKFWFTSAVMTYNYTVAEYRIICDETNNTPETIRQNKVFITIQVRFNSSIKFITVYNDAYPIGVEFSE